MFKISDPGVLGPSTWKCQQWTQKIKYKSKTVPNLYFNVSQLQRQTFFHLSPPMCVCLYKWPKFTGTLGDPFEVLMHFAQYLIIKKFEKLLQPHSAKFPFESRRLSDLQGRVVTCFSLWFGYVYKCTRGFQPPSSQMALTRPSYETCPIH